MTPNVMTNGTILNLANILLYHHSHDAMDSFYDYIWDVTILEYLTCILAAGDMLTRGTKYQTVCSMANIRGAMEDHEASEVQSD